MDTLPTVLAALLFVLALIALAGRLLRGGRFVPRADGRLALRDSLALGPRRRLLVIGCDGREFLLLTGGGQDVMLGWLPEKGT